MKNIFTKSISNSTIKKNYNPLKVNCKIYKRRDGLCSMKNNELKEITKGLNLRERIVVHINKKIFLKVFNKTRTEIINSILH